MSYLCKLNPGLKLVSTARWMDW